MKISEMIYTLRTAEGMEYGAFADLASVPAEEVEKWEAGESQPTAEQLVTLASRLGVSLDTMLADETAAEDQDKCKI